MRSWKLIAGSDSISGTSSRSRRSPTRARSGRPPRRLGLHAVGDLAADRGARAHRRAAPHRAPRRPRPISLTEAGQILLRHADAIQARLLAAKADMSALEAGDAGRLRVGTFQSVGAKIIPRLLRQFSESHPQVEVVLRESQDESELLEMIERGELDLTFWTLPVARRSVRDGRAPPRSLRARRPRRLAAGGAEAHPDAEGDRCSSRSSASTSAARWRMSSLQLSVAGRAPNYRVSLGQQRHRPGPRRRRRRHQRVASAHRRRGRSEHRRHRPPRAHRARASSASSGTRDRHRSPAAEAFVDSAIAVCRELSAEPAAA